MNRTILSAMPTWAIALAARAVPRGRTVVMRTFPDFDDQCRTVGAALHEAGIPVTILVDDPTPPGPPLGFPYTVVPVQSARGMLAYLRAPVVLHTHGVLGNRATTRRKRFVNLWHGMPIKRLPRGSDVGRNQTDVTIATATVHARNLADTWGIPEDRVKIVGLPRNDVLLHTRRDPERLARSGLGEHLAIWLPTYRHNTATSTVEGRHLPSATQFEGADLPTLSSLAERSGYHILVKPHPLAPVEEAADLEHVTVWDDDDLRRNGWTLYELLAQADLLISDFSSVWIDFLVLDRPVIIAVSDMEQYVADRGAYFDLDRLAPGGVCRDIGTLTDAVEAHGLGKDPWRDARREAFAFHHEAPPGASAAAVARMVTELMPRG